jgi:pSer/pThr/pTyr-binding forkhead associated (FHA) protein
VSANADAHSISELKARAEAERAGDPFLSFRDRDGNQQLFVLAPASVLATVGRQRSSDLVLDWDHQVSRVHARLERVQDQWEVVDDGLSSNGTFINEERLSGRRRLKDGDTLRFGSTTVTFSSPGRTRLRTDDAPAEKPAAAAVALSSTQRRVVQALCRPYTGRSGFASPATDEQIAEELVVSVHEVRTHLAVLCAKLGVVGRTQNETRVALAEKAFSAGLVSEHNL